jgi:hypothetical protein
MRVEPAHLDQVTSDYGKVVIIDREACGAAKDIHDIDPQLHVELRFPNGMDPFFIVIWTSEDRRTTQLVLTAKAHQNSFGTWVGLDERVVNRLREIDPMGRGGYSYAEEIEKQNKRARQQAEREFHEKVGPYGEEAAFALRKDLGLRYKGRAFIKEKPYER